MSKAKADLHVHSKYSDRPSEWILRRIGSPESFTEPIDVYRRCIDRGMNFVTISDHNRIDGALSIAHLPGTFTSVEITTYFPDDGAKLHCLAVGITEAQFARIQSLRENIYDLRQYFIDEDIIYSLAHPLFRPNDRLTPDHIEKLLLLFNRFEGINGTRDPRASDMVRTIFRQLTPEIIESLVDKHGIEPIGPHPWKKVFTGGSDDHGGVYIASAYTETPEAHTVEQFLDHLRRGDHEMAGRSGTSVRLAHSFYHIAYSYYRNRLFNNGSGKPSLLGEMFRRLLERPEPPKPTIRERAKRVVRKVAFNRQRRRMSSIERNLVDEFSQLLQHVSPGPGGLQHKLDLTDQETFDLACRLTHRLSYTFLKNFADHLGQGDLVNSLQTFAALGPVALSISPYLAAMATQHKDERFMQAVADRFETAHHLRLRSNKRAWLTDTFLDVNGVARTIREFAEASQRAGDDLTVVTCEPEAPKSDFPLQNFEPVGRFSMPEYENQMVALPPFLEMVEYLERERFSELVISTPGPVGLTALMAGRLLGLDLHGIYHTDFPMYVRHLTDDPALEQITRRYMFWFYDQMRTVFAPSAAYREQLIDAGLNPAKIRVLRRGVDTERFHVRHRDEGFWKRHGLNNGVRFAYVGRLSREKNLDRMLSDFVRLQGEMPVAQMVIVGDGPARAELERRYRRPGIVFTGVLEGDELAAAYASADVFVFPSTTDTFGNVVLEAQASGLPAIVTDRGGPQEIIVRDETGLVVNLDLADSLLNAMRRLAKDEPLRRSMGVGAREHAEACGWDAVYHDFVEAMDARPAAPAETSSETRSLIEAQSMLAAR